MIPNSTPPGPSVDKIREMVQTMVRNCREEAVRGVENSSKLKFIQDQLICDLISQVSTSLDEPNPQSLVSRSNSSDKS